MHMFTTELVREKAPRTIFQCPHEFNESKRDILRGQRNGTKTWWSCPQSCSEQNVCWISSKLKTIGSEQISVHWCRQWMIMTSLLFLCSKINFGEMTQLIDKNSSKITFPSAISELRGLIRGPWHSPERQWTPQPSPAICPTMIWLRVGSILWNTTMNEKRLAEKGFSFM